ncbi:MAG: glutaminase A [Flavobacteriales bacterium]|nr:glutaminase A [Flavobacteriales bacterium]
MTTKQKRTKEGKTSESIKNLALESLFSSIDMGKTGKITPPQFWKELKSGGILEDDPRLSEVRESFIKVLGSSKKGIDLELFTETIQHSALVNRGLKGELVIPDFSSFCEEIVSIFNDVKSNMSGSVANYIPQLARVNPKQFAVSICTIDGQRFSYGDVNKNFCLQSTCKPINYCIAHEELGEEKVHKHIGREPSGRSFNEMALNNDGLPHNPLINAGAIMCTSLIKNDSPIADRFDKVIKTWTDLSGGVEPSFNNSVYLSERQTSDRNFALAYFMRENNAFPENTDLIETLEFYFQCCSIEVKSSSMASVAATLANGGVNPLTGKKVFSAGTSKNCLSLMNSCGMYDFSGEYAFKIGFPAKSGVSGAMLIVIPNVMGICVWSPNLDELGNSVRGVEFSKKLGERFNFHNYDSLINNNEKLDPRKSKYENRIDNVIGLVYAASFGDIDEIKKIEARGIDLNSSDYDGRTALHLAVSEGQTEVVEYLLLRNVNVQAKDRWGGTPMEDAKRSNHSNIYTLLEQHIAK